MNYTREIERRDKRIETCRQQILELSEEVTALRQLLDCAAANIVLLVKDNGGDIKLSRKEVSEVLGKYRLSAKTDEEGNYVLEIVSE